MRAGLEKKRRICIIMRRRRGKALIEWEAGLAPHGKRASDSLTVIYDYLEYLCFAE